MSFTNRLSNSLINDIEKREHQKQLENDIADRQLQSILYEADLSLDEYNNLIGKATPFLCESRVLSLRSDHEQLANNVELDPFRTTSRCQLAIQSLKGEILAAKKKNADEWRSGKWDEAMKYAIFFNSMVIDEIKSIDAVLSLVGKDPILMQQILYEARISDSRIKTPGQLRDHIISINPHIVTLKKMFEYLLRDNPYRSTFLPG